MAHKHSFKRKFFAENSEASLAKKPYTEDLSDNKPAGEFHT